VSRREALFWLIFQLAAVAAGIAFAVWLFHTVTT
jgi:hypothetical protein